MNRTTTAKERNKKLSQETPKQHSEVILDAQRHKTQLEAESKQSAYKRNKTKLRIEIKPQQQVLAQ